MQIKNKIKRGCEQCNDLHKKTKTYCDVGMNVVCLAVFANESTGQLVHTGVEYPKAFVGLGENALQRFDLQFQRV